MISKHTEHMSILLFCLFCKCLKELVQRQSIRPSILKCKLLNTTISPVCTRIESFAAQLFISSTSPAILKILRVFGKSPWRSPIAYIWYSLSATLWCLTLVDPSKKTKYSRIARKMVKKRAFFPNIQLLVSLPVTETLHSRTWKDFQRVGSKQSDWLTQRSLEKTKVGQPTLSRTKKMSSSLQEQIDSLEAAVANSETDKLLLSINQMFITVLITFVVHCSYKIGENNWKPINLLLLVSSLSWLCMISFWP